MARTIKSAFQFIPRTIRELDAREGRDFVKRFFVGVDSAWSQIETRLAELLPEKLIPRLFANDPPSDADRQLYDELLRHMAWFLGFTTDLPTVLAAVTSSDDYARLVSVAAPLWKGKGPTSGIISAVRVFAGRPVRLTDWFGYRYILGEAGLWEEQRGSDPWIIGGDFGAYGERLSNLQIMDWPGLNKPAVLALLEVTRAVGERFEVLFPDFLDDFSAGRDLWVSEGAGEAAVVTDADGNAQLEVKAGQVERIDVAGAATWANYLLAVRFVSSSPTAFIVEFYRTDADNCYRVIVDLFTRQIALVRVHLGGGSVTAAEDVPWLFYDVTYKLRVDVQLEGANNRVRVYLDRDLIIDVLDSNVNRPTAGGFAVQSTTATTLVDDPELHRLPATVYKVGLWS